MKNLRYLIVSCWTCWMILSPGLALAQAPPPATRTISLDFRGGNALEYIEAIRGAAPEVNIVTDSPDVLAAIPMPVVGLTNVDIRAALELLEERMDSLPDGRIVSLELKVRGGTRGTDPIPTTTLYRIICRFHPSGFKQEDLSSVWTVSDLLAAPMAAEDILTAVETALDLIMDRLDPADSRFHKETGLLIARGHPTQMQAIDEVIEKLRETVDRRENASKQAKVSQEVQSARAVVADLRAEREMMRLGMKKMELDVTRAQAERERVFMDSQHQLNRFQEKIAGLEQELAKCKAH